MKKKNDTQFLNAKAFIYNFLASRKGYVKQSLLAQYLQCDTRFIRRCINSLNKDYINGYLDYFIIGSHKGNMLTDDRNLIRHNNHIKKHHALSELKMAYDCDKRLNNIDNMTLHDYIEHGGIEYGGNKDM